jgi:hypothetical protein
MRHYRTVTDETPQTPQAPETVEAKLIYANSTRASGTPWDLSVDFAYIAGDGASKHGVRIVMSWEQAAAVQGLLGRMLARYEDQFGPIRPFVAEAEAEEAAAGDNVADAEGGTS